MELHIKEYISKYLPMDENVPINLNNLFFVVKIMVPINDHRMYAKCKVH